MSTKDFVLEHFLPYRVSLLSNTVSEGISVAYRNAHGLSVPEWRVIAVLGRFPGHTASEVVQQTAMDKVTVSRAVRKLIDKGLVEHSDKATDRRRQPLKLTPEKGKVLFDEIVPQALHYEQQLVAALGDRELSQFNRSIDKLIKAAQELNAR